MKFSCQILQGLRPDGTVRYGGGADESLRADKDDYGFDILTRVSEIAALMSEVPEKCTFPISEVLKQSSRARQAGEVLNN